MVTESNRKLVLSVTLKDCDVQTFRSGGPGGQHQNKTESGVRIKHRDSGAVGESREHKSQRQNKRAAFIRMTETKKFQTWLKIQLGHETMVEYKVSEDLRPRNLLVEGKQGGEWVPIK